MGPFKNYVALRGEGVRLSVTRCDKGDSLKRYVTLLTLLRSGSCCTFLLQVLDTWAAQKTVFLFVHPVAYPQATG